DGIRDLIVTGVQTCALPIYQRLSQERASAVRAWLLEHYSLRAEHLMAKGYGEARPETRERNDEELLRNRRVVLRVLNPEALPRRSEERRVGKWGRARGVAGR